jgi:hypothetical protein
LPVVAVALAALLMIAGRSLLPAQQPSGPVPTPDTSLEDRQKINNLLIDYARDVRLALQADGDIDRVLRHFDRPVVAWFEENADLIADFNVAMPGPHTTHEARRRVALDAVCRYGPPLESYRIQVGFQGMIGVLVVIEQTRAGELAYYIPLRRDPTNRWVMTSFFWSDLMIWRPLLILDKLVRGLELTEGEQRFASELLAAQQAFFNLCLQVGIQSPPRFAQ